jgi:hypothetical protein
MHGVGMLLPDPKQEDMASQHFLALIFPTEGKKMNLLESSLTSVASSLSRTFGSVGASDAWPNL